MIISDLGTIITGKTPTTKNEEFWNGKVQFVTPGDIQGTKHISSTARYITELGMKSVKGAILPKDAVCVSCIGNIGYVGKTTEQCISNQQINSIIVNEKHNSDYVYYLMKSLWPYFKNYEGQSTTLSILNKGQFSKIEVIEHTRKEEDAIAEILNGIDNKIENNLIINDNLAAQIETFLLAYLDSEDALPVKLGDYLYIKGRIGWKGLKKSEYLPQSEYRIINGETLTQSGIDWNKAGYISEERYIESPEIMLKVGDILLSKDGTIGKIGYVDSLELPTSVASGIFVIRNTKPDIISTTFIYYLLKSRLFTSFIAARTEGSVIPHLYQKDFMEFEFPLPTAEKMAEFEVVVEPMFSQIVNNLNENKKLAALRDNLLPKLMSGELDVSELDL